MNNLAAKENEALVECVRHDESGAIYRGEQLIARLETDEKCVQRGMRLMAFLGALAVVCLGYSVTLLHEVAPYYTRIINHAFATLAVAAAISLIVFAGIWCHLHSQINSSREKVRRLILKLLAERSRNRVST